MLLQVHKKKISIRVYIHIQGCFTIGILLIFIVPNQPL